MNSKTEIFLQKYRELESIISAEYDLPNSESAVSYIIRRSEYKNIKTELDYCREVRNLLSHNPMLKNKRYAVEPDEEMIALLEQTIEKIRNPKRARHIYIPRSKVCCRSMDDLVYPTMVEMRDNVYTHIPILEDEVVVGVFSENTLLSYLIDDEIVNIDENVKFSDIAKYLPAEKHTAESFRFISQNMLLADIDEIFAEALKKNDRIGLVFVTNSGKPTEKLLGIISAWDIAGAEQE